MIDITSSYIIANGINKTNEINIGYYVLFIGFIFGYINQYIKKINIESINIIINPINVMYIVPFIIFSYIAVNISQSIKISYIGIFLASILALNIYKFEIHDKGYKFLLSIVVFLTLLTTTTSYLYILLVSIILIFTYIKINNHNYCIFWSAYLIQNIIAGDFIVSELFHPVEYYISFINNLTGESHYSTIGFLEEKVPYLLKKYIELFTSDLFSISLGVSRGIIKFLILLFSFLLLSKNYNILTVFFVCAFFPLERLGLSINILYCILFNYLALNNYKKLLNITLILLPIIILNHTAYSVLPLVYLTYYYCNDLKNLNVRKSVILFAFWSILLFIYKKEILDLINNQIGISTNYIDAHGFPFSYFNRYGLPFNVVILSKYFFVLLIGFCFYQGIRNCIGKKNNFYFILPLAIIGYIYINYSFTRIDLNSPSRLIPLSLSILIILTLINENISKFLFMAIILSMLLYPINIEFNKFNVKDIKLNMRNNFIEYPSYVVDKSNEINKFTNMQGVILVSDKQSILPLLKNSKSPFFMNLWTASNNYIQLNIIKYLKDNRSQIIFLGYVDSYSTRNTPYSTFDGVDIRARSPILFKYLSDNYYEVIENGILYAVPNINNINPKNDLFSNFDIGYASKYYEGREIDHINITVTCQDPTKYSKYKIVNSNNYFYANLKCGDNKVPSIYFHGSNLSYDKTFKEIKQPMNIPVLLDW